MRIISPIREATFKPRIIRESFKERGIRPVDGVDIVANLTNQLEIPDLHAPDLRSWGSRTPSPPTNPMSSSVKSTPPKSVEALLKNQSKVVKHLDTLNSKIQRDIKKLFRHQQVIYKNLSMTKDAISKIRAIQEPLRRRYTKRQVKPLSDSGVLTPRDTNRSITARKAKEDTAEERRLRKQWKERIGIDIPPTPTPTQQSEASLRAEKEAREAGELFFMDPHPLS